MPDVTMPDSRVSPYRTLYDAAGVMRSDAAGRRLGNVNQWAGSWNGNRFPPPPSSGCVLYLPGHPGVGSTITDFSANFLDSGIDTDDELTSGETHITCDADATTAIPAGSVISIENEKYLVTATGLTLTVVPAYDGTHSATHATNADIYKRTANNGTITGATWKRLPSGLSYLDLITDDKVDCGAAASLNLSTGTHTILMWAAVSMDCMAGYQTLCCKNRVDSGNAVIDLVGFGAGNVALYVENAGTQIQIVAGSIVADTWYLFGASIDLTGQVAELCVNGVSQGTDTSFTLPDSSANSLLFGYRGAGIGTYTDYAFTLPCITSTILSATTQAIIYQQDRHLLGV